MATERAAMGQCGATKTSRRVWLRSGRGPALPALPVRLRQALPADRLERREGGGSIELLKVPAPAGLPLRHTRGGKITDSVEGACI